MGLEGLLSPWQCRVTALVVWVLIITSWHQLSPFHPQDAEQFCLTPACIEPSTHIPHGRAQFPVLLLGLTLLKQFINKIRTFPFAGKATQAPLLCAVYAALPVLPMPIPPMGARAPCIPPWGRLKARMQD